MNDTTQPMEALKPEQTLEQEFATPFTPKGIQDAVEDAEWLIASPNRTYSQRTAFKVSKALIQCAAELNARPATNGLRESIGLAIANLEDGHVDLALLTLKGARGDALAATPQAPAAPPVLPSEAEALYRVWGNVWNANNGKLDKACEIIEKELLAIGYTRNELGDLVPPAHRTAHQNAGDWDMKAVNLVSAISALKGYTTTTGPGTPDYFQRLRDHYIAELEKAAAAFLPPLPTPPRNGRAKR